ncbi:MAG: hypothetical protein ABW208_08860 [Pyrinomonadaceae bacterium]
MTDKKLQPTEAGGKLGRRDFAQTLTMLLALLTIAPRVRASSDPCEVTAERLAAFLEAPETPPAVRDIIRCACQAIDEAAACATCTEEECTGKCYVFHGKPGSITPEDVRRVMPDRLRDGGHYRLHFYGGDLDLRDPAEGGAR